MPKPNNGLFIPLEVVKREYTGKLLVATLAASYGMPVFIGHKSPIIKLALKAKEPGILFYKSARGPGCDFFEILKNQGFCIVGQDEEAGIVYDEASEFFKHRPSLRNAGELDCFFCWGNDDYEVIKDKSQQNNDKVKLTGSPRTSLWGDHGFKYYSEQIEEIKQKHGEYIFFATNFASGNCYLSPEETIKHLSQYPSWEQGEKDRHAAQVLFDTRMIKLFSQAARLLSQKINTKIVIRPHPTENVETWRKLFEHTNNVCIEPHGDITPWIFASKCLIQNGCTSAIESASANIPTIAFGETENDLFSQNNSIPNRIAMPALGVENLTHVLSEIDVKWDTDQARRKAIIDRKVHNTGTLQPVIDICDHLINLSGTPNISGNQNLGKDSILYDIFEIYRMSRFRKRSKSSIMDQNKRPAITKEQIANDIQRAASIFNVSQEIIIKRVGPNAFRLAKKS